MASAGFPLLRCGLEPTGALQAPPHDHPALGAFAVARAGERDVEEIFPHIAVVLGIDQDRSLLPARIVEVSHTTQRGLREGCVGRYQWGVSAVSPVVRLSS
jgi:hypothetical protein